MSTVDPNDDWVLVHGDLAEVEHEIDEVTRLAQTLINYKKRLHTRRKQLMPDETVERIVDYVNCYPGSSAVKITEGLGDRSRSAIHAALLRAVREQKRIINHGESGKTAYYPIDYHYVPE